MKAAGLATIAGLFSGTASANSGRRGPNTGRNRTDRITQFDVNLELEGEPVTGWSEIQLPSTATETITGREDGADEPRLSRRTTWDDLTMSRGAKQGEKLLWNWYERVLEGRVEGVQKDIGVDLLNQEGSPVARYEFDDAWPSAYSPPQLDATSVGGDSAMGQEEITIAYDRYRRVE